MGKLTGRTALVTGAARGLGREYAIRLARLGANVGVIDIDLHSYKEFRAEESRLTADNVVDELRALGIKAAGAECDIGDQGAVYSAVTRIAEEIGDITIVVCNAGGGLGPHTENKASQLDFGMYHKVIERNLHGTVYTVNAVAPMMKKNSFGKIVTVASIGGQQANSNGAYAHYGTSKAAIIHYTRYLAQELGRYNINANCLAPGFIATGRLLEAYASAGEEKYLRNMAIKRFGTPEDCCNAVEFLTTDMSDYVTGQVLEVNGGVTHRTNLE